MNSLKMRRVTQVLSAMLLSVLLLVTACDSQPPSRYDQAQQDSTGRTATPAVVKESQSGGEFNKFFPKASGGFKTVPAQEKKGFAEYKLKKAGKDVAVMSISDILNNPSAAAKFKGSAKSIGGYPSVSQGSTGTAILVNDRYQVKVLSRDASFTAKDRETWLQKFNLSGLSRLK